MPNQVKFKTGDEFWEFVEKTADKVSSWPECQRLDAAAGDDASADAAVGELGMKSEDD